ncbi:MAG TPA: hypothetical protein VN408_01480 [Actinoplanes sp.]|nr:hypothetical protein [Actinoplanes sp.]
MAETPYRPTLRTVLCSVLLWGLVAACDSSPSSPEPPACAVPSAAPAGAEGPAGQAPGGGGLEVTDHGFSATGGGDHLSLGGLVRNTSGSIAYRTTVVFRLADVQGNDPVHEWSTRQLTIVVPVIRPGEEVAVASLVGLRLDVNPIDKPIKIAEFDIVLGPTRWLGAETASAFPPFVAGPVTVDRDAPGSDEGTIRFSVTTASCRELLPRGASAVFFNRAGAVVGGALDPGNGTGSCAIPGYDARISERHQIPAGIDVARTRVTPYCDFTRRDVSGHPPSGAPIN